MIFLIGRLFWVLVQLNCLTFLVLNLGLLASARTPSEVAFLTAGCAPGVFVLVRWAHRVFRR